jgi:hypothetical protein
MKYETIATKLMLPLLLAGLMFGNMAWADGNKSVGATCKIITGTKIVRQGEVVEFGDVLMFVQEVSRYHGRYPSDDNSPADHIKIGVRYKIKGGEGEGIFKDAYDYIQMGPAIICNQKVYFSAGLDGGLTISIF